MIFKQLDATNAFIITDTEEDALTIARTIAEEDDNIKECSIDMEEGILIASLTTTEQRVIKIAVVTPQQLYEDAMQQKLKNYDETYGTPENPLFSDEEKARLLAIKNRNPGGAKHEPGYVPPTEEMTDEILTEEARGLPAQKDISVAETPEDIPVQENDAPPKTPEEIAVQEGTTTTEAPQTMVDKVQSAFHGKEDQRDLMVTLNMKGGPQEAQVVEITEEGMTLQIKKEDGQIVTGTLSNEKLNKGITDFALTAPTNVN